MDWFEAANLWVETQLGDASGVSSFAFLVLAGGLASLLPCVYPLYPITASVLGQRTSPLGRFAHPLSYYLGLAAMYLGFGVIAGLSGGAFNEVLRWPASNLIIGGVLLALALATAGWLHFPVVQPKTDEDSHSLGATFTMGAAAGLLSSACVGPVVVSILVALAASSEALTLAAIALAALKMFAFGLGVGLPFLLIGVFGVSLPRGGKWMVGVQYAFALLIGYFALGYFAKGLDGLGLGEQAGTISLSLGAVMVGTYFLLDGNRSREERTKASLAAGVLISGVCALLALTGAPGTSMVARGPATAASESSNSPPTGHTVSRAGAQAEGLLEEKGGLTWYLDEDAAYEAAALRGKPVFIDFYGSWCTNCRAFEKRTQTDPELRAALSKAVLLKVYDTAPLFTKYKNDPRFPELSVGLPFFVITDSKGNVVYKTNDFTKTDEMSLFLDG